jgi:hypothetical protein
MLKQWSLADLVEGLKPEDEHQQKGKVQFNHSLPCLAKGMGKEGKRAKAVAQWHIASLCEVICPS